ncbi:hypothetical protein HK102_011718, partial [Quaeritorhiza haematococci]
MTAFENQHAETTPETAGGQSESPQGHTVTSAPTLPTSTITSGWRGVTEVFENVRKPDQDDRSYRLLTLESGLQALCISDPTTDKASAALDVHVGHLCDPDEVAGLAHFLEHLLFMGTEKYPVENDYNQYLSEHGGHSNAFTSVENTNYYFEVASDFLEGALDRFAQFFISPLFSESGTDREMKAVDSEHKKNLQSDNWRLWQLEKDLSNPKHPFMKFGTGNLHTLKDIPEERGIDVRKVLLDFHDRYYSANIMRLVVLGKEPLDKLTEWVVEMFTAVKNKSIPVPSFPGHPLTESELGKEIRAKPVKDLRYLEITFPLPDLMPYYRTHPSRYVSHLVGHESDGSILSLLKKKGWALALSAGASVGGINFEFFKVSIDLTEEGMGKFRVVIYEASSSLIFWIMTEPVVSSAVYAFRLEQITPPSSAHYEEVVVLVFQYIKMMKEAGVKEWIFHECQSLASMSFRFKEKGSPSSYCSRTAGYMQKYAHEDILSGPYLMWDYDPEVIEMCMEHLRPDNFRITVVSPSFDSTTWNKAEYYGTEYIVEPFSDSLKQALAKLESNKELFLPAQNDFIPENFAVQKVDVAEPLKHANIIKETEITRLWHKKDDTFWVPKANVWFAIKSPLAYITPLHCVKSRLYAELLKDALMEYSYYAECAGLSYSLDNNTEGMVLTVEGYNDKLPILLKKIVEKMRHLHIDPERYKFISEQ